MYSLTLHTWPSVLCSLLQICRHKRALNQKEIVRDTHTHSHWKSHTPLPSCSYSTVATIKKLFWQQRSSIMRSKQWAGGLPGDLLETEQRRTALHDLATPLPAENSEKKLASQNSSKPHITSCKHGLSRNSSPYSVIYTFIPPPLTT